MAHTLPNGVTARRSGLLDGLVGRDWLVGLALVVAVFAVYHPVTSHEFVFLDDTIYIAENPQVREGVGPASLLRSFTVSMGPNWVPLTLITHKLDYVLWGLDAGAFLRTNMALHAVSSALLFLALLRMTRARWRSAFVAAVFALHPLHVESVAWVVERRDVLSGLFFALTLLAYAVYAEDPGRPRRLILVLLFTLAGLLAKPMLVTLPFVLLLLDHWPLGRIARNGAGLGACVVEKIPMFGIVAAVSAIVYRTQHLTGAVVETDTVALPYRLLNAAQSAVVYVLKSVWPTGLAIYYPHPFDDIGIGVALACAALLLALTATAVWAARARPWWAVGWLWYLGMLVPVVGLVQVGLQARADRYTYLPQIGLSLALAWGLTDLVGTSRARRRALAAAALAASVALAWATSLQVGYWRNSTVLFERALSVTDRNFFIELAYGRLLFRSGRLDAAEPLLRRAAEHRPVWNVPRIELADLAARRGDVATALDGYREVLAEGEAPRANAHLAFLLVELARRSEALPHLEALEAAGEKAAGLAPVLEDWLRVVRPQRSARRVRRELAWWLATDPASTPWRAQLAAAVAEQLVYAGERDDPATADVLAAAYARTGRFEDAARLAAAAAPEAEAAGQSGLAGAIRRREAFYRQRRPWLETSP